MKLALVDATPGDVARAETEPGEVRDAVPILGPDPDPDPETLPTRSRSTEHGGAAA